MGCSIVLPYTKFNRYNKKYGNNYVCKVTFVNKLYNEEKIF